MQNATKKIQTNKKDTIFINRNIEHRISIHKTKTKTKKMNNQLENS